VANDRARWNLLKAARAAGAPNMLPKLYDQVRMIGAGATEQQKEELADVLTAIGIPFESGQSAVLDTTLEAPVVSGAPVSPQMGQTRRVFSPEIQAPAKTTPGMSVPVSESVVSKEAEVVAAPRTRAEILARAEEIIRAQENPQQYIAALAAAEGTPEHAYGSARTAFSKALATGADDDTLRTLLATLDGTVRALNGGVSTEVPKPVTAVTPEISAPSPVQVPAPTAEVPQSVAPVPVPVVKLGVNGEPVKFESSASLSQAPSNDNVLGQPEGVASVPPTWTNIIPTPEAAAPRVPATPEVSVPPASPLEQKPLVPQNEMPVVGEPVLVSAETAPTPATETQETGDVLNEEAEAVAAEVLADLPAEQQKLVAEEALPGIRAAFSNDNQPAAPVLSSGGLPPRADTGTLAAEPRNNSFVSAPDDPYRAGVEAADLDFKLRNGYVAPPAAANNNAAETLREAA